MKAADFTHFGRFRNAISLSNSVLAVTASGSSSGEAVVLICDSTADPTRHQGPAWERSPCLVQQSGLHLKQTTVLASGGLHASSMQIMEGGRESTACHSRLEMLERQSWSYSAHCWPFSDTLNSWQLENSASFYFMLAAKENNWSLFFFFFFSERRRGRRFTMCCDTISLRHFVSYKIPIKYTDVWDKNAKIFRTLEHLQDVVQHVFIRTHITLILLNV